MLGLYSVAASLLLLKLSIQNIPSAASVAKDKFYQIMLSDQRSVIKLHTIPGIEQMTCFDTLLSWRKM